MGTSAVHPAARSASVASPAAPATPLPFATRTTAVIALAEEPTDCGSLSAAGAGAVAGGGDGSRVARTRPTTVTTTSTAFITPPFSRPVRPPPSRDAGECRARGAEADRSSPTTASWKPSVCAIQLCPVSRRIRHSPLPEGTSLFGQVPHASGRPQEGAWRHVGEGNQEQVAASECEEGRAESR